MALTYADYIATPVGFRQRDLTVRMQYDDEYVRSRYAAIDDKVRVLAQKRMEVFGAFAGRAFGRTMLDYGCGSGRVVEAARAHGWRAAGCDLIPGRISPEDAEKQPWDAVTFFDSLEHLESPSAVLSRLSAPWVMVSVPNCQRWHEPAWFMGYRHRRENEHLWHWDSHSLDSLFMKCGYRPVMQSHFEDEYRVNSEQAEPNILSAIYRKGDAQFVI